MCKMMNQNLQDDLLYLDIPQIFHDIPTWILAIAISYKVQIYFIPKSWDILGRIKTWESGDQALCEKALLTMSAFRPPSTMHGDKDI